MRELLKLKRTLHYTFRAFIFAADNFVEPKKERNENDTYHLNRSESTPRALGQSVDLQCREERFPYPGIHLFS